jgi:CrcB protein
VQFDLERVILVAFAGALGAVSRYALEGWVNDLIGRPTVIGTFVVNISGALFLGLFLAVSEERLLVSGPWRTAVAVGFIGAYTTFSTLMFESVDKLESGDVIAAIANLGASVMFGLLAVYAGLTAGRSL